MIGISKVIFLVKLFGEIRIQIQFQNFFEPIIQKRKSNLPMVAWRWRFLFSSSELCEEDDGSTSETPESAGLGGSEPAKFGQIQCYRRQLKHKKKSEIQFPARFSFWERSRNKTNAMKMWRVQFL